MNHPLVKLSDDATVQAAARLMEEGEFGFVAIEGSSGLLVGVLTDRDLAIRACAGNLPADSTRVDRVMTRDVIKCRCSDSLQVAEALMAEHQTQRLVVVDETDAPVGVLSLSDLAQCEQPLNIARLLRQVTAREFRYKGSHPPPAPDSAE